MTPPRSLAWGALAAAAVLAGCATTSPDTAIEPDRKSVV